MILIPTEIIMVNIPTAIVNPLTSLLSDLLVSQSAILANASTINENPRINKSILVAAIGYVNANPERTIVNTPNPIMKNRRL